MFEKRTGEILTNLLLQWGVDHIYGLPGDSINELVDDLRKKETEIDFIHVRHEEVAALSAAAYAKLTGKLGVCLSIAGPGAVHLLNGLYDAKKDEAPVLALVGQVKSHLVGTGAFQEINLQQMFEDVSVYNEQVETAEQLPDLLNQAIKTAYTQRGVAVLVIPDDLSAVKQKEIQHLTSAILEKPQMIPSENSLIQAAKLINKAKKPVILAGRGCMDAREELQRFAEKIGAPVIVSLLGKGVIPDMHPHNLGNLGQIGTKPAYNAMQDTDLLILAGTSFPFREFLPKSAPAIQIDMNPIKIGKYYPVTLGIAGNAKTALSWLTEHTEPADDPKFLHKCQEEMNAWREEMQKDENAFSTPITSPQVIMELQKIMKDDSIISLDVGTITVWTAKHLKMTNQKLVVSGWMATMGCGLPGAIAAKRAFPNQQVIAICGDGGFQMVMHDFATAVKNNMAMIVIILNNSALGLINYEQASIGHLHYATDNGSIDFAEFAEACGGVGIRVEKREDLANALEQASISEKPVVVDVLIEDIPPLPGKISYHQAIHYSEYVIKELFVEGKFEMPPIRKGIKRLLN
ncbi:pyruvate oxidase [Heyndrickxia acidicola]|uniref:Pyruvate oxidase n=1 Tax=Heyndrickxia acidicola TaxID=209389 RepID=A0ABU6MIQ0_9BACI|nr:pyruvate oxidase [Heyndrickxia acidicola]MED1204548.1 pyruvate oxidase [Heyndrickxia acidicola]